MRGAEDRGVTLAEAADFEAVTGQGVRGTVDGKAVAIGDLKLFGVSCSSRAPAGSAPSSGRPDGLPP